MFTAEITPGSLSAIFDLLGAFRSRFGPTLRSAAEAEVVAVAERLNEEIKRQFEAGTDKEGQSHNKTGYTLSMFHVEPHALGAFVIGEGAASLVEFGFKAHVINAKPGGTLHWQDAAGDHFAKSVVSPGYRGDPYVERAIKRTELGSFAAKVVGAAYASLFLRASGAH